MLLWIHYNIIYYIKEKSWINLTRLMMKKQKNDVKIQEVLYRHHLKVNTNKTEYTSIKKGLDNWKKKTKK